MRMQMTIERLEREIKGVNFDRDVQSQRIQIQDLERTSLVQMLKRQAPQLLGQIESDVMMATEKLQIRIKNEISQKILSNMAEIRDTHTQEI